WAALGLLLSLAAVIPGCKGILGIEDRELDIGELTSEGYSGCEPANDICDSCTSSWHTCICQGWNSEPEAVLRRDCAELAPEEIRKDVRKKADDDYAEYRASLDASVGEGGSITSNDNDASSDDGAARDDD